MSQSRIVCLSILSFCVSSLAQTPLNPLPEPPIIPREVTGLKKVGGADGKTVVHVRPHVPAFRTSADGRVALRVLPKGDFALIMPEKLGQAVLQTAVQDLRENSYLMSSREYKYVDGATASTNDRKFYKIAPGTKGAISHFTLFDPTPLEPTVGEVTNPRSVSGRDVYDLKVIAVYNYAEDDPKYPGRMQLFVTPVTVTVSNPKTPEAFIYSITAGDPVGGPVTSFKAEGNEPNVVGDGRLLVMRIGSKPLAWTDPVNHQAHPEQEADIVYSYYTEGHPADPQNWTDFIPVTHAPFDARIKQKFGFAMAPFRDARGREIPDGEDLGGSYPWMDRQARNLFFSVGRETLRYGVNKDWSQGRYETKAVEGEGLDHSPEVAGKTRGVCFLGLWSHGKMVMVDNLNNDMDYAMGNGKGLGARYVRLFDSDSGRLFPREEEWLHLGGGRVNSDVMPKGDNRNTTIFESLENLFNYRKHATPISIRDVVWSVNSAKNSDEVVFDDYLDADALIVANMSGLATFDEAAGKKVAINSFKYHSGWNERSLRFDLPVRLQNAATSLQNRVVTPEYGEVVGTGGRLEPAATGGVHGKGFWMGGHAGLKFTVDKQPFEPISRGWYVGLFVDCRFADDGVNRELICFPDRSRLQIAGRRQIQCVGANGQLVKSWALPEALVPDGGWVHLAWQVGAGAGEIEFLLNGLCYDRFQPATSVLGIQEGSLIVGNDPETNSLGFRGWIDDFLVLAHTVDPETACNHAGGTLIGLPDSYEGPWRQFADLFPDHTHTRIRNLLENTGEVGFPRYANFHDYAADYTVTLNRIPEGTVSLRQSIHFPEGPLFSNAPRPDSTGNRFCTVCHFDGAPAGLSLAALALNNVPANADARRQPSQPIRRIFGTIPGGLVDGTGLPLAGLALPAGGQNIDDWMLPIFTHANVQTLTLVDMEKNEDLACLHGGEIIHKDAYLGRKLGIRANLDVAQGAVRFVLNSTPQTNQTPFLIPVDLVVGRNSVKATPEYGGKSGPARTIRFTVR